MKNHLNANSRYFLIILLTKFLLFTNLSVAAAAKPNLKKSDQTLPLEELRTFSQVYYYVKSSYVEEIDDKTLIDAAIQGIVSSLDSHSKYLQPDAFARFTSGNEGEYAGIGLSFNDHKLGIQINSVISRSPADKQGLKPGMVVITINNINIKNISSQDAYKLLQGKVNSTVQLTVLTNEQEDKLLSTKKDYSLNREIIYLPSVTNHLLPNDIGYLAISQFTKKTPVEFIDAMAEMSASKPLEKLIIDLRDNPGGVLESAIEISDFFINSGTLLTSSGRASDSNEVYEASSLAPYGDLQVIVIINAHSASSSEILAAALQDHNRATIVGDTSYGKGSIQSIYNLHQKSGLKITTAKYYSPNGHEIQDVGIQPDVLFKTAELENSYAAEILDDLELLQAHQLLNDSKRKE